MRPEDRFDKGIINSAFYMPSWAGILALREFKSVTVGKQGPMFSQENFSRYLLSTEEDFFKNIKYDI